MRLKWPYMFPGSYLQIVEDVCFTPDICINIAGYQTIHFNYCPNALITMGNNLLLTMILLSEKLFLICI